MHREKKKLEETYPNTNRFRVMELLGGLSFSNFQNFSNVIYITFIQIINKNMSN